MPPRGTKSRREFNGGTLAMITIFGSTNLDLIGTVSRIPRPGETVPGGMNARDRFTCATVSDHAAPNRLTAPAPQRDWTTCASAAPSRSSRGSAQR